MKKTYLLLMVFVLVSCNINQKDFINLRSKLEKDYRKTELEQGIKITSFSHIGEIKVNGHLYYVIDLRTVLEGMLCPRGNNWILIYNTNCQLVSKISNRTAMPLWCEDSRIYLYGAGTQEGMYGNVWEFKNGFQEGNRKLIKIPEYGSYKSEETLGITDEDGGESEIEHSQSLQNFTYD